MPRRRSAVAWTLLAAGILGTGVQGAWAADAGMDGQLDLPAMALAADDVPAGFFDDYGEIGVPAASFAGHVGGALPPPGLERTYQSFYFEPEEAIGLHVFFLEFTTPGEAAAGAQIVTELLRPSLGEAATVGPSYSEGPAVGEDTSTTTLVTYDGWPAGEPRVSVLADSFRRDRLIAGVAIERWLDPPSPTDSGSDPEDATHLDEHDRLLVADLAATLDQRIIDVLSGVLPPGADLALGRATLPISQLVAGDVPSLGGYKSGPDLLRCGICGEQNSLARFGKVALGGHARTVVVGPHVDGAPQPPFVSVAVSEFATPQDALAVLAAIRQAPNDRPTPGPVPRGERTLVDDPVVPGASGSVGFLAAMEGSGPDAILDSAGVDFVMGDRLVSIDVQGGLSADVAMGAALDLATQQAACLASSDACASVTPPAALVDLDAATTTGG